MRISLYIKVLFGYLIFGVLGFIAIAFFSSNMTLRYLVRDRADQLYNEANMIAATCRERYSGSDIRIDSLEPQLPRSLPILMRISGSWSSRERSCSAATESLPGR